jgi:hypothetical protein
VTVAAPFIGPEPRYVYRPAREYSAEECRRLRAAANAINAHWTLDPSATDPQDEPLPDVAEDGSDVEPPPEPEPEQKTRRPRAVRVPGHPVALPPVGETWHERFMRTGDPMAPAQTGREVERG